MMRPIVLIALAACSGAPSGKPGGRGEMRFPVEVSPVDGTFTREADGQAWRATARFDPGSGRLEVTCSPEAGPAQIGPALVVEDFVLRIVVAIVVPLLLVGLGLAVLIGTAILWATRSPRSAV